MPLLPLFVNLFLVDFFHFFIYTAHRETAFFQYRLYSLGKVPYLGIGIAL